MKKAILTRVLPVHAMNISIRRRSLVPSFATAKSTRSSKRRFKDRQGRVKARDVGVVDNEEGTTGSNGGVADSSVESHRQVELASSSSVPLPDLV